MGRLVRIAAGTALLAVFFLNLSDYRLLGVPSAPSLPYWFGVAVSFYFVADVLTIGFRLNWGRRPQWVVMIVAAAAVVFNVARHGSFWGPPLGLLLYLLTEFVVGVMGLSFVLAAILASHECLPGDPRSSQRDCSERPVPDARGRERTLQRVHRS